MQKISQLNTDQVDFKFSKKTEHNKDRALISRYILIAV